MLGLKDYLYQSKVYHVVWYCFHPQCWGCFVWLPSIYTSHTLYLTNHPNNLGLPLAAIIFTIGALSIYLNYSPASDVLPHWCT